MENDVCCYYKGSYEYVNIIIRIIKSNKMRISVINFEWNFLIIYNKNFENLLNRNLALTVASLIHNFLIFAICNSSNL